MKKVLYIIISVEVCLLVGFAGGRAQIESLQTWYPTLSVSPLTPPNEISGIVWSILYTLMGISIGLIIASKSKDKRFFVLLFCVQLFVNFIWSLIFFRMQNPIGAFVVVIILDVLVLWYIAKNYSNQRVSSYLFMPYAAWILFASYLNLYVMIHN